MGATPEGLRSAFSAPTLDAVSLWVAVRKRLPRRPWVGYDSIAMSDCDDGRDDARRTKAVRRLDGLPPEEAEGMFRACCSASRWVRAMVASRPFHTPQALFAAAERHWADTTEADWLEAFRGHPRIGESASLAGQGRTEAAWSAQEQRGVGSAGEDLRRALAEINQAYEARFGHIYLVCATGKSADELLAIAQKRLANDPATELRLAASEQMKITRLRLEKLLDL